MKAKRKYRKQCTKGKREFNLSYEDSNPYINCGANVAIFGQGKDVATPTTGGKNPVPERPKIKRIVVEEYRGDKYSSGSINGLPIFDHEEKIKNLENDRNRLTERLKEYRRQFAWHQKRLAKGAFD